MNESTGREVLQAGGDARAATLSALRGLLKQKGAEHKEEDLQARIPTGIPGVDALLRGGFPRGGLGIITGAWAAGKSSLALMTLSRASRDNCRTAIVDVSGCFFPPTLKGMGADLNRVLLVRSDRGKALWSAEQILRSGIFDLVLLFDAFRGGRNRCTQLRPSGFRRLQLASEASGSLMLLVRRHGVSAGMARVCVQVDSSPVSRSLTPPISPYLHSVRQARVSVQRGSACASVVVEI